MDYSILKDDTPENTIKKIKKILNRTGIKTKETIYQQENSNKNIPIVSVYLEVITKGYKGMYSCGKGQNIKNATASAYAELIERMQAQKIFEYKSLWCRIKEQKQKQKQLKQKDNINSKIKNEHLFLPFFSIKDKDNIFLPYDIILYTRGTTGMAAGNTYEEAIVQGLSEICERESIKRIFTNKIRCKTVPKQEYIKYEQIRNIIEFYEKNGFKITIKDASLNETIPVICTIFEKNGIYSLRFGAHPSLPIAIERTFTEQLQCINIEEYEKLIKECPYYTKEEVNDTPIENIILSISHMFVSFEKNKLIDDIFLNDEIQDKNKLTVWIKNENKITNKELLKFLLKKLSKISSNIFIKDMSFLKFPTVYIFIPEMAELVKWNKTTLDHTINYQMWKNFNETKNRENYNIKSLYKLAKYNVNRHYYFDKLKNVFNCPLEYVIFLCAVKIKDVKNIIKYANLLIKKNNIYEIFEEEQIKMFQIIKNYYLLKQNKHKKQEIKKELEKNYSKNEIKENLEIIKEISFEVILKTVINKKYTQKKIDKKKIEKLIEMYNKANINNTNIKYIFN